ncbi:hypothetical protein AC579_4289 [Pseudocercospora musae]|uniref:F-box domain-containing protein n=1 Tax=Pseudocercospora musae TaxID=113226 RepID=A0A139IAT6_9PEZI|nr:hypothetical protein AC579_4289 [Pseudocercospora musae]
MKTPTTAPPASQHSRFLDLPPELRNQISEAYFTLEHSHRVAAIPALTQVSRQIRSETTAMAYRDYDFVNTSASPTPDLPPVLSKLASRVALLFRSAFIDVLCPSLTGGTRRPDLRMYVEWGREGHFGLTCTVVVWNAGPISTAILKYRAWKRIKMYQAFLGDLLPGRTLYPQHGPVRQTHPAIQIIELRPLGQFVPGAVLMDDSHWSGTRYIRLSPSQDGDWERVIGCVLGETVDAMLYLKPYAQPVYSRITGLFNRIDQFLVDLLAAAARKIGLPELPMRVLLHVGAILFVIYDLIGLQRFDAGLIAAMNWILWLRAFL